MRGLLGSLLALLALCPQVADACSGCPGSPYFSGISWPEDGGTLPSNAPLFLSGTGISLDGIQVTVDGAAASLVEVPQFTSAGGCGTSWAYRIEPEPPAGAAVEISGQACDPALNDTCGGLSHTFTIAAADHEAPSPATAVGFDVYVPRSEWTCADIANTVWYLDIAADYDEPQQARARWQIEVLPGPDAPPSTTRQPMRAAEARYTSLEALSAPDESPCFRITAIDEAGNSSTSVTACEPCHFKVDPADASPWYEIPPEPSWSADERVYGGPCDDGTVPNPELGMSSGSESESGSGGALESPEGGCACALEPRRGPPPLALLGLVALGLRRSRSRPRP